MPLAAAPAPLDALASRLVAALCDTLAAGGAAISAAPALPLADGVLAIKRVYQPSVIRRKRTHGFLGRNATTSGRKVLSSRRQKQRKQVSV